MKKLMVVAFCGSLGGCSLISGFDKFTSAEPDGSRDAGDARVSHDARGDFQDPHDASEAPDRITPPHDAEADTADRADAADVRNAGDVLHDVLDVQDVQDVQSEIADAGDAQDADGGAPREIRCNGRDDNGNGEIDEGGGCWRRISDVGAPLARTLHTMVAVPDGRAVVWGGAALGVGATSTGGMYNPGCDCWSATNLDLAPGVRYTHAAAWIGNTMLVLGGYNGGTAEGTCGRLDPVFNLWIPTAPGPAIWDTTVTWMPSMRQVIVFGGMGPGRIGPAGRYDLERGVWLPMSADGAPSPRTGHIAVLDETRSRVIVWGGAAPDGLGSVGAIYDPAFDVWIPMLAPVQPTPHDRSCGHWVVPLDAMIMYGGAPGGTINGLYFPGEDRWMGFSSMGSPTILNCHGASVWTGSELVIFFGDRDRGILVGARYNPIRDEWLPIRAWADSPPFQGGFTTVLLPAGILVWGGTDAADRPVNTGYLFPLVD